MANLFNYKTSPPFSVDFSENCTKENLKNVRILSFAFLIIALIVRLLSVIYIKVEAEFVLFEKYSIMNWIQLSSNTFFCLFSHYLIQSGNKSKRLKKILIVAFVLFIVMMSMVVSFYISLYNTKNTLTLYFIGIVTASLFFALTVYEIAFVVVTVAVTYWTMILLGPISINEKLMNVFAGLIMGSILLIFSRYIYFFKSQQFVRLKLLEVKNKEIESLHQQQGEILSFVAHDLRAPISNIEALSQILEQQQIDENKKSEEIQHILKSTQLAKNIINDLIDVIKTKPGELERKDIDFHRFLTDFVNKWRNLSKRSIQLENLKPETIIVANASKLERVLDNLISNAIKFSSENNDIIIRCEYGKNTMKVKVIDQGIGIPSAMLDHIFTQFTPAGRIGLKGEKSIGLGLHIAKRIMEQHHGDLSVESEEDKGTTFTILLPA